MKKAHHLRLTLYLLSLALILIFVLPASADGDTPVGIICPHSQGYWANHPAEWTVTSVMLGTQFYTQAELLTFLPGGGGDASMQLAVQLAAVKLNLAVGASAAPITAAMLQADAVLAQFVGKLPYSVDPSTPTGQALISLASMLDAYNNGLMIAGCAPTSTPTLTVTPGPSPTPTFTPTPGPSLTPTPVVATLPVTIIVAGPVQVINVNIITIYDIDIEVNANDPVLTQIHVGDFIRVEGNTVTGTTSFVVVAVNIFIVNTDVVITNNNVVVWQDDGNNCGNPPPPWAPAHGWRRRCQNLNPIVIITGDDDGNGMGMGMGMGDDD
jgi:hypothetical protein